jgi:hypothetical protein
MPGGRPKKDRTLNAEQRQVLEQLYYTEFRSGIGMRALWERLKDHPRQKAETLANGTDSKGRPKKSWINWRDFKQWYNSQETAQLTRRAPTVSQTRSGVPPPGEMFALAHLQADLIDMGELATGRKRYIMNIVDVVTGFSFLQTWDGNVNNRQTTRVMEEIIDAVRKWLGAWPRRTELLTDNGTADFGAQFKASVEAYEPLISVVHGVPNRPNSQGAVESSNRTIRGVLRRLLRSKGLEQDQWANHLVEAGYILNTRPNSKTGWVSPADAMTAFFGTSDEDEALQIKVHNAIMKTANARRGPGSRRTDKPLKMRQRVRLANDEYMKTAKSLRGNALKQGPRWSETVYQITQVNVPGPGAPTQYKINDGTGKWHPHELLMKIDAVEAPPDAATADRDEYAIEKILDYNPRTRKYLVLYTGYWSPEWQSPARVPANLRTAFRASRGLP